MYEKTIWYDHATDPENCFAVTDNGDGTKTIIRAGTVLQQGTPLSAEHLNHMEDGIAAAAEKVTGATPGNFAGLDADGNLQDSGKKAADFALATNNRIATYYSVTQLGFTAGTPTINQVFAAMPFNSMLRCPISDFASGQEPSGRVGAVEIVKSPASARSYALFRGKMAADDGDWRMYLLLSGNEFDGVWRRMYDESADTGWLTPTLLNGWTEVAASPVRYCKDALGVVRFKGLLQTPANSATTIMNLPSGFRSGQKNYLLARGDSTSNGAKLTVWSDGNVVCNTAISPSTTIDLAGIAYRAEA